MKSTIISAVIFLFLLCFSSIGTATSLSPDLKPVSSAATLQPNACCQGKRGDINVSGTINLADLSSFVSYLTGGGFPLPCPDAADLNGNGSTNLADLSALVSFLTGGGFELVDCPIPPVIVTAVVFDITASSAVGGGTVISSGGSSVTDRGVCWSTHPSPTLLDSKTSNGYGLGSFQSQMSGLAPGTYYYVRAYATNSAGTGYGTEAPFTTSPAVPTVATDSVTGIGQTTATCGGSVLLDNGALVTSRGVCWSTNPNPTMADSITANGSGNGSFASSLTGLVHNTQYYVRAYAKNSVGTGYGGSKSFTTLADPPTVSTSPVSGITQSTAECGGTVSLDGGASVTARGVCWSTGPIPTIADSKTVDSTGTGGFVSMMTGLDAKTTYCVRAYASNSGGTGYGNVVSFATTDSAGTVTDIDGNVYRTVKIGSQWWMAENLKVIHYRNGDSIPNASDGITWSNLSTGAYCDYDNDYSNVVTYGRLYNGYAAHDSRNVAPLGWHVPTDEEWGQLEIFLGMNQADVEGTSWRGTTEGGKLKEPGTAHWWAPNVGATNESRFSALPGGVRSFSSGGVFTEKGAATYFWSSTLGAWGRALDYNHAASFRRDWVYQTYGFSVRCVKGDVPTLSTAPVTEVTQTTANSGGTITSDGGTAITARGVCWSTNPMPTTADAKTNDGQGSVPFTSSLSGLVANTKYYVRAYATNAFGTGYGEVLTFTAGHGTVTDIDGNVYETVIIGNQVWMAENLKVTHYQNGESIPFVTDNEEWKTLTTGAYCAYNNDTANVATYGRMYNWYAVADTRNLAPYGWHVPSDEDWKQLEMTLGMSQVQADSIGYRGTTEGGKLKETGTSHWISPNTGATNESGFSALPGGRHLTYHGPYAGIGTEANFWSCAEANSVSAWSRALYSGTGIDRHHDGNKGYGRSVRCVKNDVARLSTSTVGSVTQTTAQCGGIITSDGGAALTARGVCWSISPAPTVADSKTTDGVGIGQFTSSITGLDGKTLYHVRAYATNSIGTGYGNELTFFSTDSTGTLTDIDGNVYGTVKIGNRWWMAENLKVTHYRNGEAIPSVTDGPTWVGLNSGAYCEYNDDVFNVSTYGRLYNWYAIADSRKLAPVGWHVATDAEWQMLSDYLGGGAVAGGKMKESGYAHWALPNAGATNESHFSALPGGYRNGGSGAFLSMGILAYFWSAAELDTNLAWLRDLGYYDSVLDRGYDPKFLGFSVRCVKDN